MATVRELEDKHGAGIKDRMAATAIGQYGKPLNYKKLMEDIQRLEVDEETFHVVDNERNHWVQVRITANIRLETPEQFINFLFAQGNQEIEMDPVLN